MSLNFEHSIRQVTAILTRAAYGECWIRMTLNSITAPGRERGIALTISLGSPGSECEVLSCYVSNAVPGHSTTRPLLCPSFLAPPTNDAVATHVNAIHPRTANDGAPTHVIAAYASVYAA